MSRRLKTISRISQLIEHRREVLELEALQVQKQLNRERSLLVTLKDQVQDSISPFEEGLRDHRVLDSQEVSTLYEVSHFLFAKIERKDEEVAGIGRDLEVRRAVLLEAYKKEKVFGLFMGKMDFQEKREEALKEQKSLDYLNLVKRSR